MAGIEDERLLIEAAQKDPRRFGELYEMNFERVYAFIARRVRDRHEAEDVTAEVFQHALANLSKFEWRGVPFAVWLFRIATNAMADRWKKLSRESVNPGSGDLDQSNWPDIERRISLFRLVDDLPAWGGRSHRNITCERPPRLRPLRWLRDFLLMPQPPLLKEEGNIAWLKILSQKRRWGLSVFLVLNIYRINSTSFSTRSVTS